MIWRLIALLVLIATVMALGASAQTKYPVPLVNTPLVPDATTPGGHGFMLTVNGSGFTPAAVVKWNGRARKTTFVSDIQLTARISASDIAVASTAAVTVSNPGMHHTSNPVNFHVASPEQTISMQVIPTGFSGVATAADLNGDGLADLVVAQSSSLLIALGKGNGTFGKPQVFSLPGQPQSVTIGNFDRRHGRDIAVNVFGVGVEILHNNGNGRFGKPRAIKPQVEFGAMAAADLDGHGWLDLIGTQQSDPGYVYVMLRAANGGFKNPVAYQVGSGPISVAVGDFNRDGIIDLAILNSGDDSVSILLGNGDGTFQPQMVFSAGNGGGDGANALQVADFNQDGKLDLVRAAADFQAGMGVLLGNGDGTFQPVLEYNVSSYGVAAGDFNADGLLDVATGLNGTGTGILLGEGNGSFSSLDNFDSQDYGYGVSAADFNNDGRLDVAATTANGVVLLMQ